MPAKRFDQRLVALLGPLVQPSNLRHAAAELHADSGLCEVIIDKSGHLGRGVINKYLRFGAI